jgi:predicted esterase
MMMLIISIDVVKCSAYIFQNSPNDENSLLKAVQNVHATIDKEVAAGTNPNNIFICGFSQGGLSFTSRVLNRKMDI